MRRIWTYLEKKKSVREVIALLLPIAIAVIGGLWTMFIYVFPAEKPEKVEHPPPVTAGAGGVAAGHDISHATINIGRMPAPSPAPSPELPQR